MSSNYGRRHVEKTEMGLILWREFSARGRRHEFHPQTDRSTVHQTKTDRKESRDKMLKRAMEPQDGEMWPHQWGAAVFRQGPPAFTFLTRQLQQLPPSHPKLPHRVHYVILSKLCRHLRQEGIDDALKAAIVR